MRILGSSLILVIAACGSSSNGKTPDAPNVPAMITITGTATSRGLGGSTPVVGATVAAYQSSNETTPVTMTTTDASGNYTLTITTNGQPLDGFVKATMTNFTDTYLYPPAPLTADYSGASINMLTSTTFGLLYTLAQVSQTPGQGTIALEIESAPATYVAGATISTTPAGTYRYNGTNGTPDKTQTMTMADGIAYVMDVPAGQVMLTAAKSGATFKSHSVNAHADAFTTTIVTE
jgi:hypothetical protein